MEIEGILKEIKGTLKEIKRILKEIKGIRKEVKEILKEFKRTNPHIKRPLGVTGAGPKWARWSSWGCLGPKNYTRSTRGELFRTGFHFGAGKPPGRA